MYSTVHTVYAGHYGNPHRLRGALRHATVLFIYAGLSGGRVQVPDHASLRGALRDAGTVPGHLRGSLSHSFHKIL